MADINLKSKKPDAKQVFNLIVVCVAGILINLGLSTVSGILKLPFYLDSVGTVMGAFVGGPLPGIVIGLTTNVLKSISDWPSIYYGTLNVMIAVASAMFATKAKMKKRFIIPLIFVLAFIGGVLGSILTWFLFGFATEGISADLARAIYENVIQQRFLAQLSADFMIDLGDKAVTVVLAFLVLNVVPESFMEKLQVSGWHQRPLNFEELLNINKMKVRQISLRSKILILVSLAMTVIAIVAIGIGYALFRKTAIQDHTEFAQGIVKYQKDCIDPEMVDEYLERGTSAPGYKETEEQLRLTFISSENIRFMYVYRVMEDGCHVVFDMDTEDVMADEPGDVIHFPDDIAKHKEDFLAGREVEPTVSNDSRYGWVLSIYEPIYNKEGRCVCYSCVDISMKQLNDMTHEYLAKQISLFLGVFIMVLCIGIWLADYNIIYPLNAMSHGANAFVYTSTEERNSSVERIKSEIRTGDEIENLYHAYSQTTEESMQYLSDVRKKSRQIEKMQGGLLMVLADIIESRDKCTGDHIRKTAAYTEVLLRQLQKMGKYPDLITDEYIHDVAHAAPLHDIGKINIPDRILNSDSRLTDEEFETMKGHAAAGYEIINKAIFNLEESGYLKEAAKMAYSHHEKWDGSGYPQHLKGEDIPLSARVMAVADVFDALLSRRSYKEPFTFEKAVSIIEEGSGKHFDPNIVEAFMQALDQIKEVAQRYTEDDKE